MLRSKLLKLLKIQPDEARLAGLVALFFGLVDLCRAVGDSAADTLFLRRFGADNLPYMYIALGGLTFAASLGFAAGLGRVAKTRFFSIFLLAMGGILAAERAALSLAALAMYPIIWLTINVTWSLLGAIVWATASAVCDTRQAKRLFSLFVSASILGGLLGSLIIGPAARLFGTDNLLLVCALLLGLGALLIRQIGLTYFHDASQVHVPSSFISDIRAGFDFVKDSPLLQKLAVSAVLFSILYFSVSYPFNQAVSLAFKSDAEMASFLGVFKGVSSALMFIAALLIANRLYARIGIVSALLILPVTYLLGFILFAGSFSLTSAVIVRTAQFVVLSGIGDGAYGAFFNIAPADRRAQVRAFDAGIPSQIGVILSGVLLILTGRVLNLTAVFTMGMVVAGLCALVIWRMRPDYTQALLNALHTGRLEVFNQGERIFASLGNDAEAIRLLAHKLSDPNPTNQRLAAEILGEIGSLSAAPALINRLEKAGISDEDVEVKSTVLQTLARLRSLNARPAAVAELSSMSPTLRTAALAAIPSLFGPDVVEAARLITPLLSDPDKSVRRQAALSLAVIGQSLAAQQSLLSMLENADESDLVNLLQALRHTWEAGGQNETALKIAPFLTHQSPVVRRAACQGLYGANHPEILAALALQLQDPVTSVRRAAAQTLKAAGSLASSLVLAILSSSRDLDACLDALSNEDKTIQPALKNYAREELQLLKQRKEIKLTLVQADLQAIEGSRPAHFLLVLLDEKISQSEQQLVKIIGLLTNPEAMRQVSIALRSSESATRSAAIEALDTLGDRLLVHSFLPLLEEEPVGIKKGTMETALRNCLALNDPWLQAAAAFTAAAYGLTDLSADILALTEHPDPLVGQAAKTSSQILGGKLMETLPTLSLIERTILLKQVPIFSGLEVEDLAQIARSSQERWYGRGDQLCAEGEMGSEMFIIASGQVLVSRVVDGKETIIATRTSGDFIGEMSVIENAPRIASIRAVLDTRTLVFSADMFQSILHDRPEVALAVMRELSRRLRELSQQAKF